MSINHRLEIGDLGLKIEEIKNLLFIRRGGDLNSRGAKRQ